MTAADTTERVVTATPWTDTDARRLAALWTARPVIDLADIAAELGRSRGSVASEASRRGLPGRHLAAAAEPLTERNCLCCRRLFFAGSKTIRLCPRCRA